MGRQKKNRAVESRAEDKGQSLGGLPPQEFASWCRRGAGVREEDVGRARFPASNPSLLLPHFLWWLSPWLWLTAESLQCLPPPSLGNNVAMPTCLTIRAPAVYKRGHSLRSWNQGLQSLFMEDPSETVMDELIKARCWWGWMEDSLRWERLPAEIWDSTMFCTRGSSVNGTFIQLDIGGFLWKWLKSSCDCS